jgi:hypothetical protein
MVQAEGLPDSSRGSSGSSGTPGSTIQKQATDPAGVADFWHPFRMHRSSNTQPEVSAMLRPPATVCQPCGLKTLAALHLTNDTNFNHG